MNIETTRFKLTAAPGGPGFNLHEKRRGNCPGWNMYLNSVPPVAALAAMSESAFEKAADSAMESGVWS